MRPLLQQSAPRGRVGSTRGEYQQLLRHHKAQRRPQQPSLQMDPAHQRGLSWRGGTRAAVRLSFFCSLLPVHTEKGGAGVRVVGEHDARNDRRVPCA